MIRSSQHIPAGQWNGPPADSITLEQEQRDRRRIALTSDGGLRFLLDLPASCCAMAMLWRWRTAA